MKLALIGQSGFGQSVLEGLAAVDGYEVVGVFAAPDSTRGVEPLASVARMMGIPVWQFERLRDRASIETFRSLEVDLCVMAYVTDIVPRAIINAPKLGTIQYHPSLLPLHRGPSSINWAIINGDAETGLTVFWPDDGLDTGPILLQKRVAIDENDSVGSIYFNRLFPMGVDAMLEAVALVAAGDAPRIAQNEAKATYEGWCAGNATRIDWSKDARTVHNLIRGCDPQPGAWSMMKGQKVALYGSTIAPDDHAHFAPGTITHVDETGKTVTTGSGSVKVRRVRLGRGSKVDVAETSLAVGDRFSRG